jgi:ATP-dependent RNA helicase RhlE
MFSQLGLSPTACASLARLGYSTPTPIQTKAIPLVLSGVDLLARAQTGTGKTAAFGLPIIQRLDKRGVTPKPRALVLVPTRELALQVHKSLAGYAGHSQLRVVAIFGGVGMGPQLEALRRGVDVVVATPGRLIDHVQRRSVDLSSIEMLILDEADRMLDMGFLPPLKRIAAVLPRERQTLLFSATLPDDVINLSRQFTRNASRVDVSGEQIVAVKVTHQVHHVTVDRKRDALTEILTQDDKGQALVFCRTKRGANRVGEDLGFRGIRAGVIHGNKSQSARNRALDDFKTGRVRVLVATDIAARGLDIARLPLVVNFDLPLVAEDYVHRVGRTGRAGHDGRAVSLVSGADVSLLRDIQRLVVAPMESVGKPAEHSAHAHAPRTAAPSNAPRGPRGRRFGPGKRPDGARRHAFRGGRA